METTASTSSIHDLQKLRPTRFKIHMLTLNQGNTDRRQPCSEASYALIFQSHWHDRSQPATVNPSVEVAFYEMVKCVCSGPVAGFRLRCCRSPLFLFVDSQDGLTHKLELTLKHTTYSVISVYTVIYTTVPFFEGQHWQ